MEPIAEDLKNFLVTKGFNKKKTTITVKYDNKLVNGKLQRIAHIQVDGPVSGDA